MEPYDIGRLSAYVGRSRAGRNLSHCTAPRIRTLVEKHGVESADGSIAEIVATILASENHRSVHHRYPNHFPNHAAGLMGYVSECVSEARRPWTDYDKTDHPLGHIIGTAFCWNYQACEHPDFMESAAFELYGMICKDLMTDAAYELGGYEWGHLETHKMAGDRKRDTIRKELQEKIAKHPGNAKLINKGRVVIGKKPECGYVVLRCGGTEVVVGATVWHNIARLAGGSDRSWYVKEHNDLSKMFESLNAEAFEGGTG